MPGGAYFPAFVVGGHKVDFAHLEPVTLLVPTKSKPAGVSLDVVFSNHCFSETFDAVQHVGDVVDVWDGRVRRVFDQVRYDLSAALPGIVQGLPTSKVFITPESNFVRVTAPDGAPGVDYRMFFRLGRNDRSARTDLWMRVESAYSPDEGQATPLADMTRIGFTMLVDKTFKREPISTHYKR